ncbi:MAG: stage II sporulation protein P [Clostridiales bacterium]|nr:stage II sporulation protein P [Clostridiales bacterium]
MIRIKVVKASHLVLGVLVALAVVVLIALICKTMFFDASAANADVALATNTAAQWSENSPLGCFRVAYSGASAPVAMLASNPVIIFDNAQEKDASKRILIYHTHTHEAYAQEEGNEYVETGAWRTADADHSVVRVGAELASLLRMYGFEVTHDTTDNEMPDFNTAYTRSLETVLAYSEPFDMYIDLHRDAYAAGEERTVQANGQEVAQLMILLGRGDNFVDKPDFDANYGFATLLTDVLNARHPGLCRDVMVKGNRYNQHVGTPALLIEVGHNENTLAEALASMPYLAEGIATVLNGEADRY